MDPGLSSERSWKTKVRKPDVHEITLYPVPLKCILYRVGSLCIDVDLYKTILHLCLYAYSIFQAISQSKICCKVFVMWYSGTTLNILQK